MSLWAWKAPLYSFVRALPLLRNVLLAEQVRLARLLQKVQPSPVLPLDIGSGTGDSLSLFRVHANLICVDASFAMLRRLPHARKLVAHAQALPFAGASCDFISAIGVLEYVRDEMIFFREARRVLKSPGYFLFTSAPRGWANYLRAISGERLFLRNAEEVLRALEATGWRILAREKSFMQEQWLVQ